MTSKTRVTVRQMQYFVPVGETGSIARAAERISISPPSVSAAVSDSAIPGMRPRQVS